MSVLTVGSNGTYATIGAAVAAAQAGDTIEVAAGTYVNDHAVINAAVTIVGIGGMVNLVDTAPPPDEKGIFTVNADATIENISFAGAATDPGMGSNGAGIRYQSGNLTLINDDFQDNQDGMLATPAVPGTGTIVIQGCTFDHNGIGDGQTHNLYVGNVASLVVSDSTFTNAVVGHELKSRAETNIIQGNTIVDGPTGTASYDIDLPNGGRDIVQGNTIEKGPDASNDSIIHFGGEGLPYAGSSLSVNNNIIENDLGPQAVAVLNQTLIPVTVTGNTLVNIPADQIISGMGSESGNVDGNGSPLAASSQATVAPGTDTENFSGDNLAHRVDVTQSGWEVQGGGGLLTIAIDAGHVIVVGGSGGIHYTVRSGGGDVVYTAAGSRNTLTFRDGNGDDTIASAGTDTIVFAASGNKSVSITGTARVQSNSSDNEFAVNGGRAIVTELGGSDVFNISNGGVVTVTGPDVYLGFQEDLGTASINVSQGRVKSVATITGGSASGSVWNGAMSITTASGTIGAHISLGAGRFTVASFGSDTIHTGAGNNTIQIHGAAQIYADNAAGTLNVYSQGDQGGVVHGGAGATVNLYGDSAYTYIAGPAPNTVNDFVAGLHILGGKGLLTANVSAGRGVIQGGSGGIVLNDTAGGDTIRTVSGASDTLNLSGPSTVFAGGNDTITLGSANCWIQASGTTTINGGGGSSTFVLNGRETLTLHSQTTDTVVATRGAVATVTSTSALTDLTESQATVSFTDTAVPGAARLTLAGGAASVSAPSGGPVSVVTHSGKTTSLVLASGTIDVQSNGDDTITETSANVTVRGGSSGMQFIAGSGQDVVLTGTGHDTITAGSGSLTVYDQSASGTTFTFLSDVGGGVVTINDFKPGLDQLQFSGFAQSPIASSSVAAGGMTVLLANRTELVLPGVTHLS